MHFRYRQTDRWTDGLQASWHKREMYILHLALKTGVMEAKTKMRASLKYDAIFISGFVIHQLHQVLSQRCLIFIYTEFYNV